MRILCLLGQHSYGDPERGEGYEYVHFISTLRRLGHEVTFLETWNRSNYTGFKDLNFTVLKAVDEQRPDVVFSVQFTYEIWRETWEILRDAGISATLNWTTDDSWKYTQFSRLLAPAFHAFTTTYPAVYARYLEDGIPHVILTQWATDSDALAAPLQAAACRYPVSFVGTAHSNRKKWIRALDERGIEVACFGYGWPRGPVAVAKIPQIIRNSNISLNFAEGALTLDGVGLHHSLQIKARTFEVPGAGGFLLTQWAEGLDRYYVPNQEVGIFHNLDELVSQIHHYLEHPEKRDAIAQAGYERTIKEHTYEQRLDPVLEFARCQKDKYFESRGIEPSLQIAWTRFEQVSRRHILDRKLRLLRRILISLCSVVWGAKRGPRAARRLVFELSWRFWGAKTYSAEGWPGRMFFTES